METTDTSTLKVPGATLHHEVHGAGPVLLLICGGVYDARTYAGLTQHLADRYTVVTYDRRGNSRSPLDGPPEPLSVAVQADDARRLLEHVTDEPAHVFGNSSGAMFALELAARHPRLVRTVVAHDAPIFELLPEREHWRTVMRTVEETFAAEGAGAAMQAFNAGFGAPPDDGSDAAQEPPADLDPEVAAHLAEIQQAMAANMETFVGYEVPPVGRFVPDLKALGASPARIVPAVAAEPEVTPMRAATELLGERLGTQAVVFPGDHGGFGTHPAPFAAKLHAVLTGAVTG